MLLGSVCRAGPGPETGRLPESVCLGDVRDNDIEGKGEDEGRAIVALSTGTAAGGLDEN